MWSVLAQVFMVMHIGLTDVDMIVRMAVDMLVGMGFAAV